MNEPQLDNEQSGQSKQQTQQAQPWERNLLQNLVMETLKEQRASRRWKILFRFFFAFIFIAYLVFAASIYMRNNDKEESDKHIGVVQIIGTIVPGEMASAEKVNAAMRKAFEAKNSVAVVLRINSPGGSPVQAEQIYNEINRLRDIHKKPVYAVIEDVGASAAYYIASAADDIYVSNASLVGSIGVLMNGFGFVGLMDKLGIERRLITSGGSKGIMDPFSPMKPEEKIFVENMLDQIHQQFINAVKQGRGDRLKINSNTFSGLFWTGEEAIKQGLADGLGTVGSVARDKAGVEKMVDYTQNKNVIERLARQLGAGMGDVAVDAVKNGSLEIK